MACPVFLVPNYMEEKPMEARTYFDTLIVQLQEELANTCLGNMMSSPALTTHDKVFCFFSKKQTMVFKLGAIDPHSIPFETQGSIITEFNPFNTKGPLRGWWEVPYAEKALWKPLAKQSYNFLNQNL